MFKSLLISPICIFAMMSCKVTEKDISGLYKLGRFPKTTLRLNANKTFEFVINIPNPYLHPFDHPDQYFSLTKGTWTKISEKKLSITSQSDTVVYPLAIVQTLPTSNKDLSHFNFLDIYGDTVKILYVQLTDGSITAALHRSMNGYNNDLSKQDTFEFHFYGYRPYKFISGQKENHNYNITLKPEFRPSVFIGAEFRIKRKKIIKGSVKFVKAKSSM